MWNSGQSLAIETVLVIIKSRRNPRLSKITRVFRQNPRYFYIFLPILKVRVRCGLGTGQCGLSTGKFCTDSACFFGGFRRLGGPAMRLILMGKTRWGKDRNLRFYVRKIGFTWIYPLVLQEFDHENHQF